MDKYHKKGKVFLYNHNITYNSNIDFSH